MFLLLRVDHRLIHGQVGLSWVKQLGADAILVANDDVPTNELRKSTLRLARPADTKLVIKTIDDSIEAINSGKTDPYRLFIIVETIHDAYRLAKGCGSVTHINLGGTKHNPNTQALSKVVFVSDADLADLDDLSGSGVEVEIRTVASDRPIPYDTARKELAS